MSAAHANQLEARDGCASRAICRRDSVRVAGRPRRPESNPPGICRRGDAARFRAAFRLRLSRRTSRIDAREPGVRLSAAASQSMSMERESLEPRPVTTGSTLLSRLLPQREQVMVLPMELPHSMQIAKAPPRWSMVTVTARVGTCKLSFGQPTDCVADPSQEVARQGPDHQDTPAEVRGAPSQCFPRRKSAVLPQALRVTLMRIARGAGLDGGRDMQRIQGK